MFLQRKDTLSRLISPSFTASSRVTGLSTYITEVNGGVTTYIVVTAAKFICPTAATVARIMHLN